jgi:hypothetical protein
MIVLSTSSMDQACGILLLETMHVCHLGHDVDWQLVEQGAITPAGGQVAVLTRRGTCPS